MVKENGAVWDFYLRNTQDDFALKERNVQKLQDVFSLMQQNDGRIECSLYVGKKVIIIAETLSKKIQDALEEAEFSYLHLPSSLVHSVGGQIGEFRVSADLNDSPTIFSCDQILWENPSENFQKQAGIFSLDNFSLEELKANIGNFTYTNGIQYSSAFCLSAGKREPICQQCVDICPENALEFSDKEIQISHGNCVQCGNCVAICPTASLDFSALSQRSFKEVSDLYTKHIPLLVSENLSVQDNSLPKNILPFPLVNTNFLHENHLLGLIQKAGHPIVLYVENFTERLSLIAESLNAILLKIFSRKAVFLCENLSEIENLDLSPFENIFFVEKNFPHKREEFSARLASLIGNENFGIIETELSYGNMNINEENCSLCLSCADVCKTKALSVHSEDNSLRYNPSLCVQCGHCQKICPEKNCLQLIPNQLDLQPAYFQERIVAKDELFSCTKCGVAFVPSKAVKKIQEMMTPLFQNDPLKMQSLSCCPDCKAKIMLQGLSINN